MLRGASGQDLWKTGNDFGERFLWLAQSPVSRCGWERCETMLSDWSADQVDGLHFFYNTRHLTAWPLARFQLATKIFNRTIHFADWGLSILHLNNIWLSPRQRLFFLRLETTLFILSAISL